MTDLTTPETAQRRPSTAVVAIVAVVALGAGVLLSRLLWPAPGASDPRGAHAADPSATEALWTCPMHPHILEEEPGECPVCGMDLVPVAETAPEEVDTPALWTCPMHPHILEEEPGECPVCGMDLVPAETDDEPSGEVLFYRHPMDPSITSEVPAKDDMGMDFVPVFADEADGSPTVTVAPGVIQSMNVRTATAERRDLVRPIRTVGYLEYDQQRMVSVTTKYSGWVEKVFVNYVGERVDRGQPLFEIYSPELVQTEEELLSARRFVTELGDAPADARTRAENLLHAARQRLAYWDVPEERIAELEETGEIFRTLPVRSPSAGLVMMRLPGLEGRAVEPGMEIFHIANLSSLWLSVELFEEQIAWVREGSEARIELSYFPGEVFTGRVRYLEPELSERTRTIRAMIEVPNPGGRLRKGMYATVEFSPVSVRDAVAVPSQAVLRTGQRNVVVEALGGGRFRPRNVVLGQEAEGWVQILEGLEAGTEVVTSAQFLLDSESSLREAITKMVGDSRARRNGED